MSSFSHQQSGNTPEKEREFRDGNTSPLGTGIRVSMISVTAPLNRAASKRPGLLPIGETTAGPIPSSSSGSQLKEAASIAMATGISPNSTLNPNMTAVDVALQEWDRLSPEETKDLLSCVVFVLKNSREGWCVLKVNRHAMLIVNRIILHSGAHHQAYIRTCMHAYMHTYMH